MNTMNTTPEFPSGWCCPHSSFCPETCLPCHQKNVGSKNRVHPHSYLTSTALQNNYPLGMDVSRSETAERAAILRVQRLHCILPFDRPHKGDCGGLPPRQVVLSNLNNLAYQEKLRRKIDQTLERERRTFRQSIANDNTKAYLHYHNHQPITQKNHQELGSNLNLPDIEKPYLCSIHGQRKYCTCIRDTQRHSSQPIKRVFAALPNPSKDAPSKDSLDQNDIGESHSSGDSLRHRRYVEPEMLSSEDRAAAFMKHNLLLANVHPPVTKLNNTVFIQRWLNTGGTDAPLFPMFNKTFRRQQKNLDRGKLQEGLKTVSKDGQ